jgi:GntR family transcriptional regulator
MERYGVARATVQNAVAQLRAEGLIIGRSGAGLFVRDRTPLYRIAGERLSRQQREANAGTHLAEAKQVGQPSTVTTRLYTESADENTASALEISIGAEVFVRNRVMSIGQQPTQLAISRYPRTLTKGTQIEQEDTGSGGVLSRLEDTGHAIGSHVERVTLHRASAEEVTALQISPGSVCLRIERITRSDTGRVLEVTSMTLTDRYVLVYEVPAG